MIATELDWPTAAVVLGTIFCLTFAPALAVYLDKRKK